MSSDADRSRLRRKALKIAAAAFAIITIISLVGSLILPFLVR